MLSRTMSIMMMMAVLFIAMMSGGHAFHKGITTTTTTHPRISTSSSERIHHISLVERCYRHPPKYNNNNNAAVVWTTIRNVATGGSSDNAAAAPTKLALVEWNRDRFQRALMASMGTIVTWMMVNSLSLTIVQASCTTGLLSCLLFTTRWNTFPAYSVATFCGALAGMSGNVLQYAPPGTSTTVASSLLPLTLFSLSVGYAFGLWDDRKWGVGKGGRLGTMAFGGNFLFTVSTFVYQKFINRQVVPLFTLIPSTTKQLFASMPVLTSLALSTWLLRSSRDSNKPMTTSDAKQQQYISKILLYCTLAIPMFMNGSKGIVATVTEYIGTVVSIFLGSQLVHKNIGKYGPILPTSVVGMIGSILFAGSGHFGITSPKIFLGALMGLTTIPTFGAFNFLQSSFLSAILFHLGILDGFGGKLGCLAYVGVLFGM